MMEPSEMRHNVLILFVFVLLCFKTEALFCADNIIVKQAMLHWKKEGALFNRSKALKAEFFDGSISFYNSTEKSPQGFKLLEKAKGTIPRSDKNENMPINKLPEGVLEGDVFVVKSDPPLVMVYKGLETFPNSNSKIPFFIYPYRTQMEINTFPPRYHSGLLNSISSNLLDSKNVEISPDPVRNVSWISVRSDSKLSPFYTRGGFRGKEYAVYRFDESTKAD